MSASHDTMPTGRESAAPLRRLLTPHSHAKPPPFPPTRRRPVRAVCRRRATRARSRWGAATVCRRCDVLAARRRGRPAASPARSGRAPTRRAQVCAHGGVTTRGWTGRMGGRDERCGAGGKAGAEHTSLLRLLGHCTATPHAHAPTRPRALAPSLRRPQSSRSATSTTHAATAPSCTSARGAPRPVRAQPPAPRCSPAPVPAPPPPSSPLYCTCPPGDFQRFPRPSVSRLHRRLLCPSPPSVPARRHSALAGTCMTVSDVFDTSCRGTVFDLPCPDSFIGSNVIVGRPTSTFPCAGFPSPFHASLSHALCRSLPTTAPIHHPLTPAPPLPPGRLVSLQATSS